MHMKSLKIDIDGRTHVIHWGAFTKGVPVFEGADGLSGMIGDREQGFLVEPDERAVRPRNVELPPAQCRDSEAVISVLGRDMGLDDESAVRLKIALIALAPVGMWVS